MMNLWKYFKEFLIEFVMPEVKLLIKEHGKQIVIWLITEIILFVKGFQKDQAKEQEDFAAKYQAEAEDAKKKAKEASDDLERMKNEIRSEILREVAEEHRMAYERLLKRYNKLEEDIEKVKNVAFKKIEDTSEKIKLAEGKEDKVHFVIPSDK